MICRRITDLRTILPMNCDRCHKRISKLRLAALPDATTCVRCSTVPRRRGYMVARGDDATSQCVIVDPQHTEALRLAELNQPPRARAA